ncbi:MAG: hypothetical protein ABJP70_07030 [Erythrobacter sp.]
MRIFADVIGSAFGSIRFIFGLFFLCIFGLGLLFTGGASYIAPKAVDSVAARAERIGDKALAAEAAHSRNRALAAEGWGHEDSREIQEYEREAEEFKDDLNGWGN